MINLWLGTIFSLLGPLKSNLLKRIIFLYLIHLIFLNLDIIYYSPLE